MIKFYFATALALLIMSCQDVSLNDEKPFSHSEWLASTQEMPEADSAFYQDLAAPVFYKEFELADPASEALLYITAAGYYQVKINGQKVSDDYLSPAWTDFSKRIYYRKYPVSKLLKSGNNQILVELGNGWYNPLPLRMWGHANMRERLSVGQPRFILDLQISHNRETVQIVSDSTWTWGPGIIQTNNVYLGEKHDFTRGNESFDEPVRVLSGPGGELELADFPPIRKTAELAPVDLWETDNQSVVVDFGQNLAGTFQYSGQASPGDTIVFRLGERIWPDSTINTMTAVCGQIKRAGVGGPGAPDIAEQKCVFIPSHATDRFEPRFSFQGFRYVEISGLSDDLLSKVQPNDFKAWRMGTDVDIAGQIQKAPDWILELDQAIEWTMLSNVFSVISDCPAREKFGYGGDLNATAETWLYNFDSKGLLIKTVRDWSDAMKDDRFVDTAPFVGIQYCGISWESTFLLVQDYLYRFYGDVQFVEEWYLRNVEWMEKAKSLIGADLARSGLSDHESLLPVPVELVGSLHYYECLKVMERFSEVLGEEGNSIEYRKLADDYKSMLVDSLWINPVSEIKNPQTWISGLLYFDVLSGKHRSNAINTLVADIEERNYALTTGIFGTAWLLEALAENDQVEVAYSIISREDYPGWRFMLANGATTIWETWKESDNVFSQNHPMFGSVSTFFHKWLGGIDPVDSGFQKMVLHPAPVKGIDHFEIARKLEAGELTMSWKNNQKQVVFEINVPEGVIIDWAPLLVKPNQLEEISGPDATRHSQNPNQIVFDEKGKYILTYTMKLVEK